jgi:hypothetical protein
MAGESKFVNDVVRPDLKENFPGIKIIKQDPNLAGQGFPDLILLYEDKWASLETKAASNSKRQPNQEHYVAEHNKMSFSAFANPDNWQEVLHGLQETFRAGR